MYFETPLPFRVSLKSIIVDELSLKLSDKVEELVASMEAEGIDPIEKINTGIDFLNVKLYQLKQSRKPTDPILRKKNIKWVGSAAWYNHMISQLQTVVQILAARKLNKMLNP